MLIYSIILFAAAALVLIFGALIYHGKTDLIHDYHQNHIKESERKKYGRAFSKGLFVLAAGLCISGGVALLDDGNACFTASLLILFAAIVVAVAILVYVQKRFNGGLF